MLYSCICLWTLYCEYNVLIEIYFSHHCDTFSIKQEHFLEPEAINNEEIKTLGLNKEQASMELTSWSTHTSAELSSAREDIFSTRAVMDGRELIG